MNSRGVIVSTNGFWGLRYNKKDKITLIDESDPEIIGNKVKQVVLVLKRLS